MISFYTASGDKLPLTGYEEFCITHKQDGCDTMTFQLDVKHELYKMLYEECRVETDDNCWLIKKIDDEKFDCELDFDFLRERFYRSFRSETKLLAEVLAAHLPAGWTVYGASQSVIRRTIEFDFCTDYDVIYECMSTYKVFFIWNMMKKCVTVVVPENLPSTGEYLTSELNLRSLSFKGDTTEFCTRLYCYGKEGMTIEDAMVDDGAGGKKRYGLQYIENRKYSDKIVCGYWSDERYTIPESLYEDGVERLETLANPVRSYECEVVDLAKMSPEYAFLEFVMHRRLTLVDVDRGIKVEHRIVEYSEWPDENTRNTVTLSCVPDTIQGSIKGAIKSAVSSASEEADRKVESAQALMNEKIMMATAMMTGAFGSHLYTANGELFMMDNPDPDAAKVVWRWNVNGFAKSSSGINGPYTTAMLWNDEFITGIITAMVINASIINTGILKSYDGETFYLDLDNGVLKMKATDLEIAGQGSINDIVDNAAEHASSEVLQQFVEGDFADTIKDLETQLDKKAESWFQAEDPSTGWTTPEQKAEHKGDMWKVPGQDVTKQWDGSKWVDMTANPPQAVFDEIDGKAQIWASQPKPPYHENDLWFGGTESEIKICILTREEGEFHDEDWIKYDYYISQKQADDAAANAVKAQTQEDIFNKLTNGGKNQGIYLKEGMVYINASYIQSGTISLEFLKLIGTLCGLMQGYGATKSGATTRGIVLYGNGVNSSGYANPPYIIVTNAGIRLQSDSDHQANMTNGVFEVVGSETVRGAITAEGSISSDKNVYGVEFYVGSGSSRKLLALLNTNGAVQFGGQGISYIGGDPVYVGQSGTDVYLRGAVDFSFADSISGLSFNTVDALKYLLNGSSAISSSNGYDYFGANGASTVLNGGNVNIGTTGTSASSMFGSTVNIGKSSGTNTVYIGRMSYDTPAIQVGRYGTNLARCAWQDISINGTTYHVLTRVD